MAAVAAKSAELFSIDESRGIRGAGGGAERPQLRATLRGIGRPAAAGGNSRRSRKPVGRLGGQRTDRQGWHLGQRRLAVDTAQTGKTRGDWRAV